MSYDHVLVSSFVTPEVDESAGLVFYTSDSNAKLYAERNRHGYWVEDANGELTIPVTNKLMPFARAVKRAMPWVQFGVVLDYGMLRNEVHDSGSFVFCELYVYVPGQQYALGRIGYRDYGLKETIYAYGVYSRKIKIGKIKSHSDRHHTAISSDLNRAVKAATKSLVPYSVEECARMTFADFRDNVMQEVSNASNEASKFISACRGASVLTAEITNLIRQNVEFVTPEFKAAAAHYLSAQQEAVAAQAKKTGGCYIRLFVKNNQQFAEVATLQEKVGAYSSAVFTPGSGVIPVEEVPMDVQSKLAVLMSMSIDSYTPGIGYRVDDYAFWVEREVV
jgi:hypothetical protein